MLLWPVPFKLYPSIIQRTSFLQCIFGIIISCAVILYFANTKGVWKCLYSVLCLILTLRSTRHLVETRQIKVIGVLWHICYSGIIRTIRVENAENSPLLLGAGTRKSIFCLYSLLESNSFFSLSFLFSCFYWCILQFALPSCSCLIIPDRTCPPY